jgi:hypothetical protein
MLDWHITRNTSSYRIPHDKYGRIEPDSVGGRASLNSRIYLWIAATGSGYPEIGNGKSFRRNKHDHKTNCRS